MGLELAGDLSTTKVTEEAAEQMERDRRKVAVHAADVVAAEHPHPLDDLMPKLAGRLIAEDPQVRGDVRELLDAIGLLPNTNTPGETNSA